MNPNTTPTARAFWAAEIALDMLIADQASGQYISPTRQDTAVARYHAAQRAYATESAQAEQASTDLFTFLAATQPPAPSYTSAIPADVRAALSAACDQLFSF